MQCPSCNKNVPEGAKFCVSCGAPIVEKSFCTACGAEVNPELPFCSKCGVALATAQKAAATPVAAVPKKEKKFPKKLVLFGSIGVAALALIILVIVLIVSLFGGENNYGMYMKDDEIFFDNLEGDDPWQLTSNLIDLDNLSDQELAELGPQLAMFTYMSEDGDYLFFPDKIDNNGFTLYYREADDPDSEAVKIDADVRAYVVNEDATLVTYTKGEDGDLYQYDMDEDSKDKIAGDVEGFRVTEDGEKIIYLNDENNVYLKYAGKDKEKIASDISSLVYIDEDVTTIYYLKDGNLYQQEDDEERIKLATDVSRVLAVYESGEMYYLKRDNQALSLIDYVIDDKKQADAAMKRPVAPEYPDSYDYDTWDEYYDAVDAYYEARDEYDRAYDEYYDKQERDELRERLENATLDQEMNALYFFDGQKEILVSEAYENYYSMAENGAVMIYDVYDQSAVEKVKLSEIDSIYDVENRVENALFSDTKRYIAVKANATLLEHEDATALRLNDAGTTVYYVADCGEEGSHGDLYRINIKKGKAEKASVYDQDVYIGQCRFLNDELFAYFKDYDDEHGELYMNKEKVDFDVYAYGMTYCEEAELLFYYTDFSDDKEQGTLKVYDGEVVKISDDVCDYTVTPDERVLFLYDYSTKNYKGELYLWEDGDKTKLDDDVVCIIPVLEGRYKGVQ